jgi:osmotically-inducible protein OsmY
MHSSDSVVPARTVGTKAENGPPTRIADIFKRKTITSFRHWHPSPRFDVQGFTRAATWIAALLLTGALSGCAEYRSYETCGPGGCPGDANITANVQGSFAQHPELEGPDQLYVKTLDHVVYLSGTVETGLHRDIASSVAREVSGVTSVVNDIAIDK